MQNPPFINADGMIEAKFDGKLDPAGEIEMQEAIEKLALELEDQAKEINLLIDISQFEVSGEQIEGLIVHGMSNLKFRKAAPYGASKETREISERMIARTGKNNIKLFETRDEAIAWIKQD